MTGLRSGGGSSTAKTGPHVKWQPYDILMIRISAGKPTSPKVYKPTYNHASSTCSILICMKSYLFQGRYHDVFIIYIYRGLE